MSELINTQQHQSVRRNLLMSVSLATLLGYFGVSQVARAADDDKPIIWVELGGQFERVDSSGEIFAPPFVKNAPAVDAIPMIKAQEPLPFSIGEEGKITFEPGDSGWVLSAAILYGRSSGARQMHQQTALPYITLYNGRHGHGHAGQPINEIFGDGQTILKESHDVLDFKAGKDVGLGLFGAGGTSVISGGVRFAQFASSSNVALNARPHYTIGAVHKGVLYFTSSSVPYTVRYRSVDLFHHSYGATLQARRNTHALGPTISWDASARVAGNSPGMTVTVDWGLNAAVLFGRQRTQIHHQTTGHYAGRLGARYVSRHSVYSSYANPPVDLVRSRGVTIPNVGGFAGATLQFVDAKISIGYRADFFLGAMDNGIDTAKRTTIGFYGPFATISFGFGG